MTVFTLSSPDIPSGGTVPPHFEFDGFGCSGQNQSPILQWSGAPMGTQSFAVTVYDPDAPTGSGWWHWFVVDLPATTAQLVPNAGAQGGAGLPAGARQIRNDYGAFAWGGVCPPPGDKPHRYVFTVHALSVPAGHSRRRHRRTGGLHGQRPHAGQGQLHGHLRPALSAFRGLAGRTLAGEWRAARRRAGRGPANTRCRCAPPASGGGRACRA